MEESGSSMILNYAGPEKLKLWKVKSVQELNRLLAIHKASRYSIRLNYGIMSNYKTGPGDGDYTGTLPTQKSERISAGEDLRNQQLRLTNTQITIETFKGRN